MRVYTRQEFLKLPEGTVYCKGQPWAFGGINIKGETIAASDGRLIDWYYLDPEWIDAHDSGEAGARLDEMLSTGASYPMQDAIGRDGCFDENEVFLVYEDADIQKLVGWLIENIDSTPNYPLHLAEQTPIAGGEAFKKWCEQQKTAEDSQ